MRQKPQHGGPKPRGQMKTAAIVLTATAFAVLVSFTGFTALQPQQVASRVGSTDQQAGTSKPFIAKQQQLAADKQPANAVEKPVATQPPIPSKQQPAAKQSAASQQLQPAASKQQAAAVKVQSAQPPAKQAQPPAVAKQPAATAKPQAAVQQPTPEPVHSFWNAASNPAELSAWPNMSSYRIGHSDRYEVQNLFVASRDEKFQKQLQEIHQYVKTPDFAEKEAQRRQGRGIVIAAGGKNIINFVVLMRQLREVLHCQLPVQWFYWGTDEVDAETIQFMVEKFSPLSAVNMKVLPYPQHHNNIQSLLGPGWVLKVWALYNTHFSEVLVLDYDAMPLINPEHLFLDPSFIATGNLFWTDWPPDYHQSPDTYDFLGLDFKRTRAAFEQGKAPGMRETESGMIYLNLTMHREYLEYVWLVNSFFPDVYHKTFGDKETFPFAFALAGKAHLFNQVAIPMSNVKWPHHLVEGKNTEYKDHITGETRSAQMIAGLVWLQYTSAGIPAFFHITCTKLQPTGWPWYAQFKYIPPPEPWQWFVLGKEKLGYVHDLTTSCGKGELLSDRVYSLQEPQRYAQQREKRNKAATMIGCGEAFKETYQLQMQGLTMGLTPDAIRACQSVAEACWHAEGLLEQATARNWVLYPQWRFLEERLWREEHWYTQCMAYVGAAERPSLQNCSTEGYSALPLVTTEAIPWFNEFMAAVADHLAWATANEERMPAVFKGAKDSK